MPSSYSNNVAATDPCVELAAVAPNDSTDLGKVCRALYVGVSGSVVVIAAGDTTSVTLSNVMAGTILPVRVKRVLSTGTTASAIVALY